ncbi:MAG: PP2C family protein-serine/threonine phosphatase [Cyanobacteria bacterium SBLK]|nr:PP2C family protein-serine/threonine phosphatase [Cyanobacteria bacterium SBLK]
MTAAPLPHPQSPIDNNSSPTPPVAVLKDLVARLHREQNRIQNLLSSLGFALRSFNNLNQFLEIVPLMAARVTDADGGALVLLKPNGQPRLEQLHCQEGQACRDMRRSLERITREMGLSSPATPATASFKPQILDEKLKEDLGEEIHVFGTPILVKNEDRGRLYIFSYDPSYSWTSTRKKLVQLVADQTAVAIANNELANELRKKERLDRELEIASEIQEHLFPKQCPAIAGVELAARCQTAHRVGGDYYDFIPATYEQFSSDPQQFPSAIPWSIVIGDVMGKGVPAGLIMTMTRGMLRAEVLNRHSPAKILNHLNQVMYDDLEKSHRFLTLFYSEYDPQTRILSYTNAAHNPPLLWQAASQSIHKLDTWGMLIGLESDSQYEDDRVQLETGDTVIYYTDGFTDAVNKDGDRFDEDRFVETVEGACKQGDRPQAILDFLFDRLGQFIGAGNRYEDDMTLVVLQVTE